MKLMNFFFACLLTFVTLLPAQEVEVYFNQLAEEYFLLGMRQYSQKEFKPALHSFQRSIDSYPMNHRITAAMMMEAKTLYALRNFQETSALCDSILLLFPGSLYIEDVIFTRGMCYYNQNDYQRTFTEMYRTFVIAQQRLNKEHSYKVIEHITTEFFSEQQIDSLLTDSTHGEIKNLLLVVLAEKYFQSGNIDDAKESIERFDRSIGEQSLVFRINRLLSRIEKGNTIHVGVLLPLLNSSPAETREKKIAAEILEGIQLAVSDYEERTETDQVSVELDIQDSEKDSAKIHAIISEWTNNSSTVGIVGPVFSNETIHAAKIAQEQSIPIISPTATDEGISSIGPYVFQANSTNGARGKTMAQYAVNVLGAKNIAVLASSFPSSSTQADSFIVEAQRLGATIIIERRFKKGESDLRSYVRAIRIAAANLRPDYVVSMGGKMSSTEITRKLVSLGMKFSYIDSVIAKGGLLNLTPFFGDSSQKVADSLKLQVKKTSIYLDSLNYPVTTIDLIYCPISSSHEIGVITSQIAFYNIKAQLLGSGDWNAANELDMNKRYADGAIFGSERWIEKDERTTRIFAKYAQNYGRQMNDNVMLGYDAMTMLIRQFNGVVMSREQLAEGLSKVKEFEGIRNRITLTTDRVNTSLHILQYKNGSVSRLQIFSYQ